MTRNGRSRSRLMQDVDLGNQRETEDKVLKLRCTRNCRGFRNARETKY